MTTPTVFIGSSSEAAETGEQLAIDLRQKLGKDARIVFWKDDDAFRAGSVLFDRLLELAGSTDFAVLLLTPTDRFGGEVAPNVSYELGLFMGQIERYRTIIAVADGIDLPSDLGGLLHLKLDHDDVASVVARRVRDMGQRVNPEIEMAALERMLNVCTPAHDDHEAPHLRRLKSNKDERFDSASDFFELTRCLLRRYVIGSLEPSAIEHLRIYFAVYLGDGVSHQLDNGEWVTINRCLAQTGAAAVRAQPTFVMAVSNPRRVVSDDVDEERLGELLENDWLLGQPISGYEFDDFTKPHSTCAKAFADRKEVAGSPDDSWNLEIRGEAAVLALPVLWKQHPHVASIGVLAISSENPQIEAEHTSVIQRLRLVANVLGVAADRLSAEINPTPSPTVGIHLDYIADSRSFARRAVELRRVIGEFALTDLTRRRKVKIDKVDSDEWVVEWLVPEQV